MDNNPQLIPSQNMKIKNTSKNQILNMQMETTKKNNTVFER